MRLVGFASTATLDNQRCVIMPGAAFLSIAARGLDGINLHFEHDTSRTVGRIDVLEYREDKLWCEAEVDGRLSFTNALRRPNHAFGFSIGGKARRWRREPDGTLIVHTIDLHEISITDAPRNPDCTLSVVSKPGVLSDLFGEHDAAVAAATRINIPKPVIRYEGETL